MVLPVPLFNRLQRLKRSTAMVCHLLSVFNKSYDMHHSICNALHMKPVRHYKRLLWAHMLRAQHAPVAAADSIHDTNPMHQYYTAQELGVPVECKRTEVGELQSLKRAAAGVTGDRSSGLSMPVKCDSIGDHNWSATFRAVAVLGYDNGDPAIPVVAKLGTHPS